VTPAAAARKERALSTSTPPDGDKPTPRSRKGIQTRARLLDAAKQIFEEHGFLDARISDIAERAGLSHGAFYHYFDSKEQIFRELAATIDAQLSQPLDEVVLDPSSKAPPAERLREAIARHFERYRDEARMMGVIEQVSRYDDDVSAMRTDLHRQNRKQVSESIRQMQRRGLCDTELDPLVAAAALGGMTWRFAEMWLVEGEVECDFDDAVEQVTRLFVNALGVKETRRRCSS
jgi:AcrR family transcriptional regulator